MCGAIQREASVRMIGMVVGIGCRASCVLPTLEELLVQLRVSIGMKMPPLQAIACWVPRQHHPTLLALTTSAGVPLEAWSTEQLSRYAPELTHHSTALYARTGLWGIAEAAALASARTRSCSAALWVPRTSVSTRDATGAIALW